MKYSLNPHIFVFGKTIKKPKISISFLSYLLRGKQNILIDTVPDKAADAYIQDIESVLPVSQIDALILNHSEEDHSGALQAVLDRHPQPSPAAHLLHAGHEGTAPADVSGS